jgi:hypothetical protein
VATIVASAIDREAELQLASAAPRPGVPPYRVRAPSKIRWQLRAEHIHGKLARTAVQILAQARDQSVGTGTRMKLFDGG